MYVQTLQRGLPQGVLPAVEGEVVSGVCISILLRLTGCLRACMGGLLKISDSSALEVRDSKSLLMVVMSVSILG